MTSARRRLVVLASIPMLVVGLAACAPSSGSQSTTGSSSTDSGGDSTPGSTSDSPSDAPSESAPEPGVDEGSPSEPYVEPVFTAVAPTPRLPVDCEQLFSSLDGLNGGTGYIYYAGSAREAVFDQAGFLHCGINSELAGTLVRIEIMVGVEIPRSVAQARVDEAASAGHHTAIGGELSYSDCGKVGQSLTCWSAVYANGYFAEYSISRYSAGIPAVNTAAALDLTEALGARIASWGTPPPAWRAPANAVRWASDCETDVASTDASLVDAVPFPVGSPIGAGSEFTEFALDDIADERVGYTSCQWAQDPNPVVSVVIVPGASWMFAQPGALTGTPYRFSGALAAYTIEPVRNNAAIGASQGTLQLVVDDSLVIVSVASAYDMPSIPTDQLTTIPVDIAEAIIAEFGNR